jgi:hypothetical protein
VPCMSFFALCLVCLSSPCALYVFLRPVPCMPNNASVPQRYEAHSECLV